MSARILKECRALLPLWAVGMLLVLGPPLLLALRSGWSASELGLGAVLFGFGLGAVLLAVSSFGKEFAHGTYGLLLAQPVSRWRLWWEKTLVLGAALASVGLTAWVVSIVLLQASADRPGSLETAAAIRLTLFLTACAAYCGGLGLTLLLRQSHGAFWLTVFFPPFTGLFVYWIASKFVLEPDPAWVWTIAVLVYSASAYAAALGCFLKRQDLQWLGGDVTLPLIPSWRVRRSGTRPSRQPGPAENLLAKELRFQELNLVGGIVLVLLFLAMGLARRWEAKVADVPLTMILQGFYLLVWGLIPFFIGACAIAEERRLGLLEWQQSLPISRVRQFLLKLLPACALSVLLAAVLPWALDALGYLVTGHRVTGLWDLVRGATEAKSTDPALAVTLGLPALAAMGATLVGLFASSLSRSLLQALTLMAGLAVGLWALTAVYLQSYERWAVPPWQLLGVLGGPTLLLVLGALAFRNYCEAIPGFRLWRLNLTVLGLAYALVVATTSALYARVWEHFIPEPKLGILRIAGPAKPRILCSGGQLLVLLPEGTLRHWTLSDAKEAGQSTSGTPIGRKGDWADVALAGRSTAGVRTDGTLWSWELLVQPGTGYSRLGTPIQLGTDRDWRAVAGGGHHFVALKTDGSLWAWGLNQSGQLGDGTTEKRDRPVRVGFDTNWAEVAAEGLTSVAVKSDGSAWEWGMVFTPPREDRKPGEAWGICRSPRRADDGTNWVRLTPGRMGGYYGIQSDGSLWYLYRGPVGPGTPHPLKAQRLWPDTTWTAVAFGLRQAVGLKDDGSLWAAQMPPYAHWVLRLYGWEGHLTRHSNQTPWIAIAATSEGTSLALAGDGSLWSWGPPLESVAERAFQLIPYSRRPHRLALLTNGEPR